MKNSRILLCSLSIMAGAICLTARPAGAQPAKTNEPDDVRAYMEMLRSDFNATKIRTLNQVMKLTGPEADAFWPVYREYEKQLADVGTQKLALIRDFMAHYRNGTLTDQNAKTMAAQWLKNTQARLDLWKKYNTKISKAVSPIRAAQFLQVENQMALFVDMSIASEMPEIAPSKPQSSPK